MERPVKRLKARSARCFQDCVASTQRMLGTASVMLLRHNAVAYFCRVQDARHIGAGSIIGDVSP
jgi:hypothetical protein